MGILPPLLLEAMLETWAPTKQCWSLLSLWAFLMPEVSIYRIGEARRCSSSSCSLGIPKPSSPLHLDKVPNPAANGLGNQPIPPTFFFIRFLGIVDCANGSLTLIRYMHLTRCGGQRWGNLEKSLHFILSLALYFLIYLIKVMAAKKRHFAVPPGADGNLIYAGHDNIAFFRTS